MLTKIETKLNRTNGTTLNIKHWFWHVARCWVNMWHV